MSNDKVFYVYVWIRLDTNEPFYVGKGKGERWRFHYQRNERFQRIINKTDVAVCIIADELTEQEALETEIYCIWYYRDVLGYDLANFTDGGEGLCGYRHTEETRRKLRKLKLGKPSALKGRTLSEETKKKIREALKGRISPNKGKQLSLEHRMKLKENHKGMTGKTHSEETREKISRGRMGWNPTEETREKMRNNCIRLKTHERLKPFQFKKGNTPWNKGRPWSEEERRKLSLAHKGKTLPEEQKEKIRKSTQKTYDSMLKERFPEHFYTAIKEGLKVGKLKKDICNELSISMHHLRRIIEVYERESV